MSALPLAVAATARAAAEERTECAGRAAVARRPGGGAGQGRDEPAHRDERAGVAGRHVVDAVTRLVAAAGQTVDLPDGAVGRNDLHQHLQAWVRPREGTVARGLTNGGYLTDRPVIAPDQPG